MVCGARLSRPAEQTAARQKRSAAVAGLLATAIMAVGVFMTLLVSEPEKSSHRHGLQADLRYDGHEFQIANRDDFDWIDVVVRINDEFELRLPRVAAATSQSVEPSRFIDYDGRTLDPRTHTLKSYTVVGTDPEGSRLSCGATFEE
jgi:hypothetical protein